MLRRILGGVAISLATSVSASAQVPGYAPNVGPGEVVTADVPARGRAATLGKPSIPAVSQLSAAFGDLAPSPADLGTGPDGFSHRSTVDTNACNSCPSCGPEGRFWGSVELLYWITSGQSLPPLSTTAPAGTPQGIAGVIGQPNTTTTFGGERANNDWRWGYRATGGMWLDEQQTCGIEADFLYLGTSHYPFQAGSLGTDIITRPFFNASTGAQDTELVSFPGVLGGLQSVDTYNRVIGGGVNYLHNLCCDPCGRTDLILGYRYLNVTDIININENLVSLEGSSVAPGTLFVIRDSFKTSNNFHGGVIGIAKEEAFRSLYVGIKASVALGTNYQVTTINGGTSITPPGGTTTTYTGGLLAQSTNIGRYTSNSFAVLPEIGLKAGVQLTPNMRVYAGYNFLYLSNVARAGDQIDTRVNTSLLPPSSGLVGSPVPAYDRKATDFWMQGVTFGAELRF